MGFEHLIDLNDFPVRKWNEIVSLALKIRQDEAAYSHTCAHKIMATLFYEPSTRTQMSFQTAMLKLGGRIIGFDNPQNSSVAKGENLMDTIKVVSGYADIMVMRHPTEGAAKAAALYADCPVINAGDGGHLHPTQTLTDLVTLQSEKSRLSDLTIGLCGDLKNGRTVHSLIKALSLYPNNRFILISTKELGVPHYIKVWLRGHNCHYREMQSLTEAMAHLDVLYMTRIQKERFSSEQEYLQQKDTYILTTQKLFSAKPELSILHPLPRVDEIDLSVDSDHRAIYFKQANYGVYARMALIMTLLKENRSKPILCGDYSSVACKNPNCITNQETYLKKSHRESGDMLVCEFCDERQLV